MKLMTAKTLFCIAILSSLTVGCDVVTSNYETMQDARNDRLFERGWLPDILPDSTTSIRTSNDLDINTSVGEFLNVRMTALCESGLSECRYRRRSNRVNVER